MMALHKALFRPSHSSHACTSLIVVITCLAGWQGGVEPAAGAVRGDGRGEGQPGPDPHEGPCCQGALLLAHHCTLAPHTTTARTTHHQDYQHNPPALPAQHTSTTTSSHTTHQHCQHNTSTLPAQPSSTASPIHQHNQHCTAALHPNATGMLNYIT